MQSRRFFLYTRSSDLAASRHFYTDLIGLEQTWDEADSIAYGLDDAVQFSIHLDPTATVEPGWAFQPGWVFGLGIEPRPPLARASWSIPLSPERFRAAVGRLQHADVEALRPEPFWVNYWSYVVEDPMGQTVELSDPDSSSEAAAGDLRAR